MFSALSLAAGCGVDDELDPSEEVDTTTAEQAVSWTSLSWHSCTSQHCAVGLGSSADRTCFLAGIQGKLASGSGGYPAGANVVDNGSWGWILWIENPGYEDISVMTACIPNTANRVTAYWQTGTPAKEIAPGPSSTRRCFLSGVYSYGSTGFSTFSSNVKVWRDGNYHYIGGDMPAGSNDTIFATCVDVATNQGEYAYGNGTSSTVSGNLTYNPSSGGVVCGLTGFGGQFTTNNPGRGVIIDYNASTRYWNWTLSPWTGANALCVK